MRLWIIDKLIGFILEIMPKSTLKEDISIYQNLDEAYVQMKYNAEYKRTTIHVTDMLWSNRDE